MLDPAAVLVAEELDTPLRRLAAEPELTLLELRRAAGAPAGTATLACARDGDTAPRPAMTAPDTALLLMTSGTTSRPKLVPLSHRNLVVSAQPIARTLGLSRSDRCLNVMPLFHIHGLVAGVLASLSVGASVSCAAPFDPQAMLSWLQEEESTWYTAVPTMHHAVLSCVAGTAPRPARLPSRTLMLRSFAALLRRDFLVAGKNPAVFLARVLLQPVFLLFVFGKLLTNLGATPALTTVRWSV